MKYRQGMKNIYNVFKIYQPSKRNITKHLIKPDFTL